MTVLSEGGISFPPSPISIFDVGGKESYNRSAFPPKGTVPIVTLPPIPPTVGTGFAANQIL